MVRIDLADGCWLEHDPTWLAPDEAEALRQTLAGELAWRQEWLHIAGRRVAQPRLTAWYGDPGARYAYSGLALEPLPWTPQLGALRARVAEAAGAPFNAVLCNLYRGPDDAVGWHADAERELGAEPLIASLSLGETRRFELRHERRGEDRLTLALGAGALLVMGGATQRWYRHRVPKERAPCGARINLTFRRIIGGDAR